jgi:hypothetical protein
VPLSVSVSAALASPPVVPESDGAEISELNTGVIVGSAIAGIAIAGTAGVLLFVYRRGVWGKAMSSGSQDSGAASILTVSLTGEFLTDSTVETPGTLGSVSTFWNLSHDFGGTSGVQSVPTV